MTESGRGAVGWGDAITAAAELGLRPGRDLDLLVEMLGLQAPSEPAEPEPAEPAPAETALGQQPTVTPAPLPLPSDDDLAQPPDRSTMVTALPDQPVDIFTSTAEPPLELLGPATASVRYEPPVPARLLRAAMTMLVRRDHPSEEIDLVRVIDSIAHRRPLTAVPCLNAPSTQHGVTVIADVSSGMMPYLADVDHLLEEIEHVAGVGSTTVIWIGDEDTPPDPQHMPAQRTPVLVLSTLGMGQQPELGMTTRRRWLEFAAIAKRDDLDVLALVPHRSPNWPDLISEAIRLVAWDDLARAGRGRG